jgi:DNA-binding response OmpR family regulator
MVSTKILAIEDDPDILELVQYNLGRQGFTVITASDGETGLKVALDQKPNIILLDIMLPGMDGLEVCRRLKKDDDGKNIPVIMLTAKGEESDVVLGLEIGADDYVTKPFSPNELVARIRTVLRRTHQLESAQESDRVTVGPIAMDLSRHEVFHRGTLINLTLAEFNLLHLLCSRPGRVFTREQLLEKISGKDIYLIDRNVDVHVRSIRKKLGEDAEFIVTIRGVGYKCKDE